MTSRVGALASCPGGSEAARSAGRSAATPAASRGMATRPSARAVSSTAMDADRLSTPKGTASRSSKWVVHEPDEPATWIRVRRKTSGRSLSSGNSSSLVTRPLTLT